MKTLPKSIFTALLALALTGPASFAQDRPAFSQAELDQMLAPIALYPDALLSQIMMAATYPLDVVQAARWSRANAPLAGEDAVRAVEPMDWDPSVKSLVAFPQILNRMDEQLDWTERLGEAFLVQEPQVMDTIQGLRRRAAAAGHLGPNEQMQVARDGEHILIEPASPQVVYVPYYNPAVVYGPWWWPAYPPVYWAPWPGYHVRTPYAPAYLWGSGIVIRIGFFFGHFDWPRRHVTVVRHHSPRVVVHQHTTVIRRPHAAPDSRSVRWQHDPQHRRGAPFRHVERRESRPAHPVTAGSGRRPGGAADSPRAEPRSFPQPPPRPQPAAPRANTRPSSRALDRQDRQARPPVAVAAPIVRNARGPAARPAAAVREEPRAARPVVSRGSPAPRAARGEHRVKAQRGALAAPLPPGRRTSGLRASGR